MRRLLAIALLVAGCAPHPTTAEEYQQQFGGLTGAYRAIIADTDCANLNHLFDTAKNNHTTGYMTAINDRMLALKCP